MFKRYLVALEYPTPNSPINVDDPRDFRNLVLWLEDQKIRHYKIEDRAGLRKISIPHEWDDAYKQYKIDLNFPPQLKSKGEELQWLLLYAIKLEYSDNIDKYTSITAAKKAEKEKEKSAAPSIKSTNPFDNLDFTTKEFEEGSQKLAEKLGITYHPDHLIALRASARVISTHLNKETLKEEVISGKPYPIFESGTEMGFKDKDLEKAGRILRLLQIQSVRQLQTAINETIVLVQNITADPRTDTKLGKVGF
uniref:Putative trna-splicing ligase complex n=1 Tax=Corethrella appendiculata TaxID=1370023 RepID=U5EZP8_9DIPT